MSGSARVALIRASLPTYFPERHGIYTAAEEALSTILLEQGGTLLSYPDIPMDGASAQKAVDWCRSEHADLILLLHGGFTMGDVASTLAASQERVGFWAVPEPTQDGDIQLNAFVSLNMSLSISRGVRDLAARPVQWYFGDPGSVVLRGKLRTTVRALSLLAALRGARVGSIGGLAPTFYNMETSTSALRARLGVDVSNYDMDELVGRLSALDRNRVLAERDAMLAAARNDGVSEPQMLRTAEVALALHDIAREHGLTALAVSDWPQLQLRPGMHPGGAFSWLEERYELPIASEGDVMGAVSQLITRELAGRVGCLLDMTAPDLLDGSILMWHGGGGPLYLADAGGARWINHPMLGRADPAGPRQGAIVSMRFQPGPVTVFRVGRSGGAMFVAEAEVVERASAGFDGSRGWVRNFRILGEDASVEDVVATVMAHGLEHHFSLVPHSHGDVLAEFAAWTGQQLLGRVANRAHLRVTDYDGPR